MLAISAFASAKDNEPKPATVTWDQLAETLCHVRWTACTPATCVGKGCPYKDGPAWTPGPYAPGTTRGNKNVLSHSVAVLDIDHVADLTALQSLQPLKRIIHASHSDREGDRCVRVLPALSRPVLAHEFKAFRSALTTWLATLGIKVDPATKDFARLYYFPSRPVGADFHFESHDGGELDVDALLVAFPGESTHASSAPPAVSSPPPAPPPPPLGSEPDVARWLGEHWPSTKRHVAHQALAGALVREGWDIEDVAEFAAEVAECQQPGNGDVNKRRKDANDAKRKLDADGEVTGWPTLIEILGEDVVNTLKRGLGIAVASDAAEQDVNDEALRTIVDATQVANAPTEARVRAALEAARDKLKSSKTADKKYDGKLLTRILKSEFISDLRELTEAAIAVVRYVPEGTMADQVSRLLLASSGNHADKLPELVQLTMERAAQVTASAFNLDEKSGKPRMNDQGNLDVAFGRLGVTFAYDEFNATEVARENGRQFAIQDHHENEWFFAMQTEFDLRCDDKYLNKYINNRCHRNTYHPVREYLAACEAISGDDSLPEEWLIRFGGAQDTPYVRAVSKLILIAACRRVRKPGSPEAKFDEILILESMVQGAGKSSAIQALVPNLEWFNDDISFNASTRELIESTEGVWIAECGEMQGHRRADPSRSKNTLARNSDRARLAYGRRKTIRPRQFVQFGTVNNTKYLRDFTGNRRYWSVRLEIEFDIAGLRAARDELWGAAARLESAGASIRLDPSLYEDARQEQESRRTQSRTEQILARWFGEDGEYRHGKIRTADLRKLIYGEDRATNDNQEEEIGELMERFGWVRSKHALRFQSGRDRAAWVGGDGRLELEAVPVSYADREHRIQPVHTGPRVPAVLTPPTVTATA